MSKPDALKKSDAQKKVAQIAMDTAKVIFTDHAQERMDERNITTTHVIHTLRRGAIVEAPYLSDQDDWRMNFQYRTAGLAVTVTVAIDWPDEAIIVTAF